MVIVSVPSDKVFDDQQDNIFGKRILYRSPSYLKN